MKFYVSTTGIKRVTLSSKAAAAANAAAGGKGSSKSTAADAAVSRRSFSSRTVLPAVVLFGIVSLFVFVRIAVLVLESSAVCSSLGCVGWRFFSGGDPSLIT
ncbi:hypothetical protein Ahy_A07g031382 isoform F [Arachis hypogaea]|uniref:Uncharacterized protein n=1 Tax=Arachis hypogaea TaxID=3818 RepID=A0A445C3T1_ARAHY|nr:hypothetical protein Ahy_A07g031382 isoform F [Arachis hypogaea]